MRITRKSMTLASVLSVSAAVFLSVSAPCLRTAYADGFFGMSTGTGTGGITADAEAELKTASGTGAEAELKTVSGTDAEAELKTASGTDAEEEGKAASMPDDTESSEISAIFTVQEDQIFGAVLVDTSIEDFNARGFVYGDACSLAFSNGQTFDDVPYYNGYYTKTGEPLLCAYPGEPCVKIAFNNGDPMWKTLGLAEGDTVTITRLEAGRYSLTQQAMDTVYSPLRGEYPDDETFSNFRAMAGGDIAPDRIYRGASPVNNIFGRAAITDELLGRYGIRFVLDLADKAENIAAYEEEEGFSSPNFMSLYENGNAALVGLSVSYRTEAFKESLASGLKEMLKKTGPYYIHCTEGKDRTGAVCLLLEALCGASYEEIRDDYMKTYENYYGITPEKEPEKYQIMVDMRVDDILGWLAGAPEGADLSQLDFREAARDYLREGGMSATEILRLREILCR